MTEPNGRGRRPFLGALASASATALGGCGYRSAPGDRRWSRTVPDSGWSGSSGSAYLVDDVILAVERRAAAIGNDDQMFQTTIHRFGAGDGEELGTVELGVRSAFEVPQDDTVLFVLGETGETNDGITVVTPSGSSRKVSTTVDVQTAIMGSDGLYVVSESNQLSGPEGATGDDSDGNRFAVMLPTTLSSAAAYVEIAATETGCTVALLGADERMHVQSFTPRGERRWAIDRDGPPEAGREWSDARSFVLELVDDALVYAGPDVVVFDAKTGSVRATASGSARPTAVDTGERTVYVGAGSTLHAFDRRTWSKRWSYTVERGEPWRGDEPEEEVPPPWQGPGEPVGAGTGPRVVAVDGGVAFAVDDAVTELAVDGSVRWKRTFSEECLLGVHRNSLVFRNAEGLVARRR